MGTGISKNIRLGWMDALKAFGIVLVVVGHSSGVPVLLKKMIYGFHMPLFFVLSGYLFNPQKYKNTYEVADSGFKKYIIPYFILSFVNLFLNAIREARKMELAELAYSTVRHVFYIFYSSSTSSTTPNCSPLWFLTCLFLSTIYFYIYITLTAKKRYAGYTLAAGMFFSYAYLLYVIRGTGMTLPWHFDTAFLGALFMLVGYGLRKIDLRKISTPICFSLLCIGGGTIYKNGGFGLAGAGSIGLTTTSSANLLLIFISASCMSAALICLFERFYQIKIPVVEFLGRITIIVMAFNYVLRTFFRYLWKTTPLLSGICKYSWWLETALILLVCLSLSIVWAQVKKQFPKIAYF